MRAEWKDLEISLDLSYLHTWGTLKRPCGRFRNEGRWRAKQREKTGFVQ